ncbi:putative rhomboid protease YdcA [Paraliobacillus quinghaiensis]|uniref:Rhomboid protease YdcA n=1 Tax=Paraliobacillus quinghaiensis TaxID=470815 RepID=A0A917WUT2_9BACI|nr:rhomboid family intramembrane serine protease [Paraliobacillus quinghaiensis]GGM34309.1 putative rhomboid protease YdcA [Paraliobacillus quinghaiensis]
MFFRTETFKGFIKSYPTVSIIIGIQLFVWLSVFLSSPLGDWFYAWGIGWNARIQFFGEYWRFITPIFLHNSNGFMHILFNSFSLVLFGPALEQMLGKWKFVFTYLFTGIAGNVFTYLVEPTSSQWHLGASGAIYGLIGLYIYMAFFRRDLIDPSSRQIVITIAVIGLIMTFLRPNINIYAHLFGFIGGLSLGPIILTKVRAYSPWRNQQRTTREDNVGFNPNRWKKRRYSVGKNTSSIIWGVIIALVILGFLSRFF